MFCKKGVYRKFAKLTAKLLCLKNFLNKVSDLRPATLLKKRLREEAQVFSCEFCEISKNTYSYRTPQVAASLVCCHLFYKKNRTAISVNLFLNSILPSHYYLALNSNRKFKTRAFHFKLVQLLQLNTYNISRSLFTCSSYHNFY